MSGIQRAKAFLDVILQGFPCPIDVILSHPHSLNITLFALLSLCLLLGLLFDSFAFGSLALSNRLLLRNGSRSLTLGGSLPFSSPTTPGSTSAPTATCFPLGRLTPSSFFGSSSGVFCLDPAAMLLRVRLEELSKPFRDGLIRRRSGHSQPSVSPCLLLKSYQVSFTREGVSAAYFSGRRGRG
jgi:hypothetical protein